MMIDFSDMYIFLRGPHGAHQLIKKYADFTKYASIGDLLRFILFDQLTFLCKFSFNYVVYQLKHDYENSSWFKTELPACPERDSGHVFY